jgi:hypothetical protein
MKYPSQIAWDVRALGFLPLFTLNIGNLNDSLPHSRWKVGNLIALKSANNIAALGRHQWLAQLGEINLRRKTKNA